MSEFPVCIVSVLYVGNQLGGAGLLSNQNDYCKLSS